MEGVRYVIFFAFNIFWMLTSLEKNIVFVNVISIDAVGLLCCLYTICILVFVFECAPVKQILYFLFIQFSFRRNLVQMRVCEISHFFLIRSRAGFASLLIFFNKVDGRHVFYC